MNTNTFIIVIYVSWFINKLDSARYDMRDPQITKLVTEICSQ